MLADLDQVCVLGFDDLARRKFFNAHTLVRPLEGGFDFEFHGNDPKKSPHKWASELFFVEAKYLLCPLDQIRNTLARRLRFNP
jgi:hypothetical protein